MKNTFKPKIVSVFLAFLFVVTVSLPSALAVPEPSITVGSVAGKPGNVVSVPIKVSNNPGIIALRIFVTYDAEVLQLTDVQDGTVFHSGKSTFNNHLEKIPYTMLWEDGTTKTNYSDDGTLVTLTFTILDSAKGGISPITVAYDSTSTFNVDLTDVSFTMQNGSVTVAKEEKLYTATFVVDGAVVSTKQYHEGGTIVSPYDPTKDGYTFKGWTPTLPATMSAKDMTFTAVFEKNPESVDKVTRISVCGMTLYYQDGGKLLPKVETQGNVEYAVAYKVANPKILSVADDGTVKTHHWGKTDVAVTVTDTNGIIFTETCTVEVKCHVWQWLIIIFLFGWVWY